ncbi:MAG: hypothetical protein IV086_10005 [Hyphomonadaceae bacterium]|nr:MAG: hypothetical protein FD160_1746 [Caulobacteraceae bacterium]MBT9446019.1 hypothetical protein [Hyphomonadaceae bacterium]TPW02996.1 MAG: hypothetical protein FD124_3176 [Alphaproteobacteria bacterium]
MSTLPHLLNVALHVAVGAGGLALGLVVLLTVKGGALHRRLGKIFAILGAISLMTAAIGVLFFDPLPPLISATLAFGYQFLSGLRALALKARGPGPVDFCLAIAGLGGCWALYSFMGAGTSTWPPIIGYSAIFYTSAVALYDLSRFSWARAWRQHARPLDHGLKMAGAYFAMMSAGFGNVFRGLQPWSQVGPSVLGVIVILGLATAYVRKVPGAGARVD